MEIPSVVHPIKINIEGHIFEVVTYAAVTDDEAVKIAQAFYRTRRFNKKGRGKIINRVNWLGDERHSEFL